jgi:hypothetical protein
LNFINCIRDNPTKYAEKILEYKNFLSETTLKDKNVFIYNQKYIVPGGEELFDDISNFFKSKEKLSKLKGRSELLIHKELGSQEDKIIKKEFDNIYVKNQYIKMKKNYEYLFKNFNIFTFMGNSSIEDGIFMLIISSYIISNQKINRAVDIITNKDIKFLGVNLEQKNGSLVGFLIFADEF